MAVNFRLLGAVKAFRGDERIDLGPARRRSVLAALLFSANQPVSVEALIERVWADHPPDQATNALYSYLTRLRQLLADDEVRFTRHGRSYTLVVDEQQIDLHRFRRLVADARACCAEQDALLLYDQALRLWQGEPFAGLDAPWLREVRAALEAEHHAAVLGSTDLRLNQGQHDQLVPELTQQADRHPLDERVTGQLMLALYRGGRQADALQRYHEIRSTLPEETGVDPSEQLRQLYQRMVTADDTLILVSQPAEPSERADPSPAADSAPPALIPLPRQLPAVPRSFIGRTEDLAALSQAVGSGPAPIVVISGAGGIGKTWLALRWAHERVDRFPDGQLFVNLQGFDPVGPADPVVVLRGFLVTLGVKPQALPEGVEALAGLFRSVMADKQMLIVLDNALDMAHVLPLLPGNSTSTVLITSRNHMNGLVAASDAIVVPLDVLSEHQAKELVASRLGAERVLAERQAIDQVIACCGGLPLALSVVIGQALEHPEFSLESLAGELTDATSRLAALDVPDVGVRAALATSFDVLTHEQARLLDLFGLVPSSDAGLPALASLAGVSPGRCRALLRSLEMVSLVHQHRPGRYRLHDLVRMHARERAESLLPAADRDEALRRLVDHYLHSLLLGQRLMDPRRPMITVPPARPDVVVTTAETRLELIAWYQTERHCMTAAQRLALEHGWDEPVWQLAWCMNAYSLLGDSYDWETVARLGIQGAERLGALGPLSQGHRALAEIASLAGHHDQALEHLRLSSHFAIDSGDLVEQTLIHVMRSVALWRKGDKEAGLASIRTGYESARKLDQFGPQARLAIDLAMHHVELEHAIEAAILARAYRLLPPPWDTDTGIALLVLGKAARQRGDREQAMMYLRQAIEGFDEVDRFSRADALAELAETYVDAGNQELARSTFLAAGQTYSADPNRQFDFNHIQKRLADLDAPVGASPRS